MQTRALCLNDQKKGYPARRIIDSHVHMAFPMALDDTARFVQSYITYFGLDGLVLLSLPHSSRAQATDPFNALKALYLKRLFSSRRVYVFGGLYHHFDRRDSPEGFVHQLEQMRQMGCDGLKMLLGKPPLRLRLGVGLDDPLLEGAWRWCEKERFPVTLHLGDPAPFWRGQGAQYTGADPSLEMLRAETENVLTRHPELDLTLCHFYFMADEPKRALKFMRAHKNVSFDLTPGSEMYYSFSQDPAFWSDFFLENETRILFGTDSDNWDSPADIRKCERSFSYPFNLVRNALEGKAPFRFEDVDYGELTPLRLTEQALQSIYSQNLLRRLGDPRPVDGEMLRRVARHALSLYRSGKIEEGDAQRQQLEAENLEQIASGLI